MVGATTLDEYRRYIEKDAALERRFQPVTVGEPSREEAVQILFGLRDRYEAHHKATITDEAIRAAVELSDRYISDRYLPDKAIDLMDEASQPGAGLATYISPPDMKALEDKLNALLQEKEEAVNNQNFEQAAAIRMQNIPCANRCRIKRKNGNGAGKQPMHRNGKRHCGSGQRLDRLR